MRNKVIGAVFACFAVALVGGVRSHAHVLIADERDRVGAVLHITPDDDPIAGKSAHIFYDIQDDAYHAGKYEAMLEIEDMETRKSDEVAMDVQGSYVRGVYTFATQGVYELTLSVRHADRTDRFVVTQRVSRGTPAEMQSDDVRHRWAELLLVVNASGLVVLGIIAVSRGRSILKQSK